MKISMNCQLKFQHSENLIIFFKKFKLIEKFYLFNFYYNKKKIKIIDLKNKMRIQKA